MKKTFYYFAIALLLGINTTFAQGTCVIGLAGQIPAPTTGYVVTNSGTAFLNQMITKAIGSGSYRSIKINSGTYQVNDQIDLAVGNVAIEGAGSSTIICPATTMPATSSIFSISTERNAIRNLTIRTKRNTTEAASGIKINAVGQRNIIENIYFGDATITSTNPQIFVNLPTGEADYNSFDQIFMINCQRGIVMTGAGVFNHNVFNDIHFDGFTTGLDFTTATGTLEGNVITNLFANANASTQSLVKDIKGSNNTFQNINFTNWPATASTVISVSANSNRTIIENMKGTFKTTAPTTPLISDAGNATLLINNQNNNNTFDYISNQMQNTTFRGANGWTSVFNIQDFETIKLKPRGATITAGNVLTAIDNLGTVAWKPIQTTPITSVVNSLTGNKLKTTLNLTAPALPIVSNEVDLTGIVGTAPRTLFSANGWLRNTTAADNYTRTVLMNDPATGINSNLKFTRDGSDGWAPSDVMMLYTDKTSGSNDANCVVIGAWTHKIAAANQLLPSGSRYKLLVNGRIKAKTEILVTETGWADYVFAKEYSLKPLHEVANFISEKGHLPNMPSAKEIETDGLPLANITTKQQEKIEELTLYAIEQDKKIKVRQSQLDAQQKEIETLQVLINQLTNKNK